MKDYRAEREGGQQRGEEEGERERRGKGRDQIKTDSGELELICFSDDSRTPTFENIGDTLSNRISLPSLPLATRIRSVCIHLSPNLPFVYTGLHPPPYIPHRWLSHNRPWCYFILPLLRSWLTLPPGLVVSVSISSTSLCIFSVFSPHFSPLLPPVTLKLSLVLLVSCFSSLFPPSPSPSRLPLSNVLLSSSVEKMNSSNAGFDQWDKHRLLLLSNNN